MAPRGSGVDRRLPWIWAQILPLSGENEDRGQEVTVGGSGLEGHSPCSSLLAAARRVEEVLPPSVLGVPGRLLPLELPPDGFRSLLGGVFFFYEFWDWGCELENRHHVHPAPPPQGWALLP